MENIQHASLDHYSLRVCVRHFSIFFLFPYSASIQSRFSSVSSVFGWLLLMFVNNFIFIKCINISMFTIHLENLPKDVGLRIMMLATNVRNPNLCFWTRRNSILLRFDEKMEKNWEKNPFLTSIVVLFFDLCFCVA